MEFVRGLVVRSKAGRDKGGFFTLLSIAGQRAIICDGKRRSLATPKCKNLKHLAPTGVVLSDDFMKTDRAIRKALRQFDRSDGFQQEEVISCQNRT